MTAKREWPVTLKVEIEADGLKRVVEEGRLMEFTEAFATLASEHIRYELVDQLAKAGVGLVSVDKGMAIAVGFDIDDPYGTGPKPFPWPPRRFFDMLMKDHLRVLVHREMEAFR